MQETIKCTVEGIIYRNDENGYSVLEVSSSDGRPFIAVGIVAFVTVGENAEITGEWTEHKQYGEQFKIASYTAVQPTELDDIEAYLSNGTIRGIGESTARMIVDKFGDKTFDILDNEPERLLEIPGIGKKKLELIITSYNQQRANRTIMLEMQKYDITPLQVSHIYRRYGDEAVSVVRQNPYRLIDDIENIGFKIADKIAAKVGIATNSEYRIKAGIRYILDWAKQEGHTYLPYDVLVSATAQTINVESFEVTEQLESLLKVGALVDNVMDGVRIVFLPYMRRAEINIAVMLTEQREKVRSDFPFDVKEEIQRAAQKLGITPAKMQYEALSMVFTNGVSVITGGPGTGKTTILKLAIDIMQTWGMSFSLCAPTGRAAKRMTLATGQDAQTMHRLLEYSFIDKTFMRDEDSPLETDFVIVDEMSMVDVQLMDALLKAVTNETHLILVGDADQLPSVGAGNVLRDILDSETIPSVRLTEVYRQAQESMIISNAHRINNGIEPVLDDRQSDFNFYDIADAEIIKKAVISVFTDDKKHTLHTENVRDDVQVLAPMKKGMLGVNNLNLILQETLNPPKPHRPQIQFGETIYRLGDKVMQIKNNYSIEWTRSEDGLPIENGKGIFNGDIGIITDIDERNKVLTISFESGYCAEYTQELLPEITLAYCISIHKSQGSEFPNVLLILSNTAPSFLTRNLLYTAVTRAKKQVCIFGKRSIVNSMVHNKSTKNRYTALKTMLTECSTMK